MTVGQYIRELRTERGLLLRDVAQRMGCAVPFVCDLELDRRPCSALNAAKIADALNVPREHLVEMVLQEMVAGLDLDVDVRKRKCRGVP
jgi:transcriptional regulator with XRE-family HTH domain